MDRLSTSLADLSATVEKDGLAGNVSSAWTALQDSMRKLKGFLGA